MPKRPRRAKARQQRTTPQDEPTPPTLAEALCLLWALVVVVAFLLLPGTTDVILIALSTAVGGGR